MDGPGRFFHRWNSVSFDRLRRRSSESGEQDALRATMDETAFRLGNTLVIALDSRDPELELIAHSARVSRMTEKLAHVVGVSEEECELLRRAAQLHEIGMISVPLELVRRPAPLRKDELERVRAQAAVGAEIVRTIHDRRASRLIAYQYEDHVTLATESDVGSGDLLLTGILRLADVLDAMSHPRPYQPPAGIEEQAEVLRAGAGTRFHPLAVHAAMRLLEH